MRLVQPGGAGAVPRDADHSMIDLLIKARHWRARPSEGKLTITDLAREERINTSWLARVVRLNFLGPELVRILTGSQPALMNAAQLTSSGPPPLNWNEQVEHFAIP